MEKKWWTLVAVCTGVFMLLLDVTIVNVALFDIQRDLDGTLSDLQWVIDAYALSLAALLLTSGSLADLYGRRRLFGIGTVVFTIGSTLCGLAPSLVFLCIARAAQGVGGAMMFATALALLASAFHGKERGTAFGLFGATTGIAVAVGPVLGGVLTSGLSWRWIFFVNIPICLVALGVTLWKVEESRDPRAGRPDWLGFLTFSAALGLLVYGLIEAGRDGWGDTKVLACLLAGGVLLAVFVITQMLLRHPMFDLSLLRKPTFTGGLIAAFAVSGSIFALLTYLVIYVQNVLGYSAVQTGVRFLFLSGASFFVAALAGRLTSHVPTKWLIAPGFAVLGVGLLLLLRIGVDTDWTVLIPGLLVSGVGIGLINTPLASTAVGVVTPDRSGMASGVNSTFRQVGIATGIAALGSIFSHQIGTKIADGLAGTPVAGQSGRIADAVTGGQLARVLSNAPAGQRGQIASASRAAFVDSLNEITLIAAVLAFAAAALTLVLIRQKDFVHSGPPPQQQPSATGPDQEALPGGVATGDLEPAYHGHHASQTGGAHRADVPVQ